MNIRNAFHPQSARALAKTTAAAHARQKATFSPQLVDTPKVQAQAKIKRRVSLGVAINAETGEVIEQKKRHSSRRHTMLNTSETINRVKDAEEKKVRVYSRKNQMYTKNHVKSTIPKKNKAQTKTFTQDELIARALDMEEDNIAEHRDYLSLEEERRRLARVVRANIQGPLLRWVSKREETVVANKEPQMQQPVTPQSQTPLTATNSSLSSKQPERTTSHGFSLSQPGHTLDHYNFPPISERIEVCKNYVIHELDQSENAIRPSWHKTMTAMFGDHANWEEMKVYTTKGRPSCMSFCNHFFCGTFVHLHLKRGLFIHVP